VWVGSCSFRALIQCHEPGKKRVYSKLLDGYPMKGMLNMIVLSVRKFDPNECRVDFRSSMLYAVGLLFDDIQSEDLCSIQIAPR
jgi:hypothetical protein